MITKPYERVFESIIDYGRIQKYVQNAKIDNFEIYHITEASFDYEDETFKMFCVSEINANDETNAVYSKEVYQKTENSLKLINSKTITQEEYYLILTQEDTQNVDTIMRHVFRFKELVFSIDKLGETSMVTVQSHDKEFVDQPLDLILRGMTKAFTNNKELLRQ